MTKINHKYKQGELGGMCGMYAIINIINYVTRPHLDTDKAEKLFTKLIKKNKKVFPEAIYDGVDFDILKKFVKSTIGNLPIDVSYPFLEDKPETVKEYLDRLRLILDNDRTAAIVAIGPGLHVVEGHWTVITKITPQHVYFLDSNYDITKFKRSKLTFSFQNSLLPVYPVEVIVFKGKSN